MYLEIGFKYEYLDDTKINSFSISNFMSWFHKEFKNVSQKIIFQKIIIFYI